MLAKDTLRKCILASLTSPPTIKLKRGLCIIVKYARLLLHVYYVRRTMRKSVWVNKYSKTHLLNMLILEYYLLHTAPDPANTAPDPANTAPDPARAQTCSRGPTFH